MAVFTISDTNVLHRTSMYCEYRQIRLEGKKTRTATKLSSHVLFDTFGYFRWPQEYVLYPSAPGTFSLISRQPLWPRLQDHPLRHLLIALTRLRPPRCLPEDEDISASCFAGLVGGSSFLSSPLIHPCSFSICCLMFTSRFVLKGQRVQ